MLFAFVLNYSGKSKEMELNLSNNRLHVKSIARMASSIKLKPTITPFSTILFSVRGMVRFNTAPIGTV